MWNSAPENMLCVLFTWNTLGNRTSSKMNRGYCFLSHEMWVSNHATHLTPLCPIEMSELFDHEWLIHFMREVYRLFVLMVWEFQDGVEMGWKGRQGTRRESCVFVDGHHCLHPYWSTVRCCCCFEFTGQCPDTIATAREWPPYHSDHQALTMEAGSPGEPPSWSSVKACRLTGVDSERSPSLPLLAILPLPLCSPSSSQPLDIHL